MPFLPSYRSGYSRRFHPYPRYAPSRREVMANEEFSDEETVVAEQPLRSFGSISTLVLDPIPEEDEGVAALEIVLANPVVTRQKIILRRRSLTDLVLNLIIMLRRKGGN